jgi:hypothetical protein
MVNKTIYKLANKISNLRKKKLEIYIFQMFKKKKQQYLMATH